VALGLLFAGTIAGPALAARTAETEVPDKLVFPIAGPASWTDDFGDARPQGSHEGNDIVSDWRAPVVAVEAGKIRLHLTSAAAGCMLYLYGKSGTTYLYIHLNNDRTANNDGRGGCKSGVAYAPGLETGDSVRAGELLGYVGSSGDAGATNHLHFELHPNDGAAVSPYRVLKRAERPLFAVPEDERLEAAASPPTLTLTGELEEIGVVATPPEVDPTQPEPAPSPEAPPAETTPAEPPAATEALPPTGSPGAPPVIGVNGRAQEGTLVRIRVTQVQLSSGEVFEVERAVTLTVAADAVVERERDGKTRPAKLEAAKPGEAITLTTAPIELDLKWQLARPGTLSAASIVLRGVPEQ
jgi:hypothetical protein